LATSGREKKTCMRVSTLHILVHGRTEFLCVSRSKPDKINIKIIALQSSLSTEIDLLDYTDEE